jgi:hypothetical protein
MIVYDFIVNNKELLKIAYGLLFSLICFFIVLKSDRLFRLSLHNGIRYFRNAFLFYGVAFFFRYILGASVLKEFVTFELGITKLIFEFFMVMAGFFLLYSLIWKRIEGDRDYSSSLTNINVILFYSMALIISVLDFVWHSYNLLFISQIILFLFLSSVSYTKSRKSKKGSFLRFYFTAMALGFATWILNALASSIFNWHNSILITIYSLNIIIFLVFLIGVLNITRK